MKIKIRILLTLIIFIIIANVFTLSFANDNTVDFTVPDFTIYSDSAILMDSSTGKILAGKDINKEVYPASTTKILTAILAIENCSLDEQITASRSAVMCIPSGYSNAGIVEGETISVRDLLDMFLIHSANEIGFIFAEHISGSVEAFSNLMNKKALELGCINTNFTNPSGIHDVNHYSSAYDLALITKYCMKNEVFRNIVSKFSCKIAPTNKYGEQRYYKNTNNLLDSSNRYYYESAIGVKTGFTSQAKNCLISASKKDGLELIVVALGAEATENGLSGRYVDTINLFNYGYENYKFIQFATENTVIKDVVVSNATNETKNLQIVLKNSISGTVPNSVDLQNLDYSVEINDDISAPIAKGSVLGKITYDIDGIKYCSDLIANHDVEKSNVLIICIQITFALIVLVILAKLLSDRPKGNKKNFKKNKKSKKNNEKNISIYKFDF